MHPLHISSNVLTVSAVVFEEVHNAQLFRPGTLTDTITEVLEWIQNHVFINRRTQTNGCFHTFQVLFRTIFKDEEHLKRLDLNSKETHKLAMGFILFLLFRDAKKVGGDWDQASTILFPSLGLSSGSQFAEMYKKEVFPNAASISQVEFLADGTSIADIALLQERENWGLMSLFLGILSRLRHHALFVTNNGMIGISYGAQQGRHPLLH